MSNATEAAEALFHSCEPLAWRIANSFSRNHPWLRDDFVSDALLALWQAALRHDPTRGAMTTFATVAVTHACLNALGRAKAKGRQAVSLHAPNDERDPGIADPQPAVGAALEARDELNRLPPDLVAEAELRLEGWAAKDIDSAAGLSRQARSDRRLRILRRLEAGYRPANCRPRSNS